MIGWLLKDYFWLLLMHTSFLHNWIVVHLAKGGTVSQYTVVAVCYVFFAICDEKKTSCSAKNLKYTFHFICCTIFLKGYSFSNLKRLILPLCDEDSIIFHFRQRIGFRFYQFSSLASFVCPRQFLTYSNKLLFTYTTIIHLY